MGVDMLGIAVGSHLYLMPRPGLGGKFQTNLVSLLIGDSFLGRKGLNVLVEIDAVQLVVGGLGSQKFREGIGPVAVQSGYVSNPGFRVGGLILPLAVPHHCLHGTYVLFRFLDVSYSCQPLPPMRTSSS